MNTQLKVLTLTMVLSAGVLCSPPVQAADEAAPSAAQRAHDEAQQLLKARDEGVKAKMEKLQGAKKS